MRVSESSAIARSSSGSFGASSIAARYCVMRLRHVASTPMDVAQGAKRREILRRSLEHGFEFLLRFVELAEMQQRPAEGDARGKIPGMSGETAAANVDGFLMPAEAPALFGELRKRNRRRIVFDPASKVFQSNVVRHSAAPEGRGYLG